MAYTSVTNTFTNGTNTDGPQVNTNFADVLAGLSDGTKDLNMNAATFAGTVTMSGAVTLGNATNDDITFNGSLASSIPIKTTHSYDFGTVTHGARDVFFGSSAGTFTTQLRGADVLANKTIDLFGHDITLPTTDGNQDGSVLMTDNAGGSRWADTGPKTASNYCFTATMAANALTITMYGSDGNSMGASNAATFAFRNPTITGGTYELVKSTSNLSVVISSGSTLGHLDGELEEIYLYVINDGGTLKLAASSTYFANEEIVYSSTAEGGAGAADDRGVLYSTLAATNKSIRFVGKLISTQATAGTWVTAISNIYCTTKTERGYLRYDQNVAQSFVSATKTVIEYERHKSVTGGIWLDDSVAHRFYVGEKGKYQVEAAIAVVSNNWTTASYMYLYLDVSNPGLTGHVLDLVQLGGALGGGKLLQAKGSFTFDMEAGAYITISLSHYTNGTGPNSTQNSDSEYNWFTLRRVG